MQKHKHAIYKLILGSAPYVTALVCLFLLLSVRTYNPSWITGFTTNYLSIHIVLEFIGILVSFAIFTVGWATYQNVRDSDILILSIASFAVGALDLGHTLTFTGMPYFFGPSGPNKSIDFWFASRATGSLALLYISLARPRFARHQIMQWILFGASLAWVLLCFWAILFHIDSFPIFFTDDGGLTRNKQVIEWAFVLIASLAGILLFANAEKRENLNVKWMACASLLYGMSGYFFTIYRDFNDVYVFTGHCFKAASYLLLYRAVFLECVSKPYERARQLALEAQASNLSKSRFLANVSHEFRTPLGVIGGFGDLMLTSQELKEPIKTWAQTIVRNSRLLSMLIDDLLDLAKAETDKIEIHLSQFNLPALAEDVKNSFETQTKNSVRFEIENKMESREFVITDELRLRQIFNNVVGNAVKFTSEGQIRIILKRLNLQYVEILVEDSGIGIAPEQVERLFLPFSQVSNPNNRRFGGTGLGLSLSRKLAELLGGTLTLKWSNPGSGSGFAFAFEDHLKENVRAANPKEVTKMVSEAPSFKNRNILIAEDSIDNQILLRNYLKPTQINITFADNGRIALDLAKHSHFDLILMDIQMPEMDGFETTLELRKLGWNRKIIALTAHALQPEKDRAMQNGFDNYLVKPIKKEVLWQTISTYL